MVTVTGSPATIWSDFFFPVPILDMVSVDRPSNTLTFTLPLCPKEPSIILCQPIRREY